MDRLLQTTIDASLAEAPYTDNSEYLLDELKRLDLILHIHATRKSVRSSEQLDLFKGLEWSEEDTRLEQLHILQARIQARIALSTQAGVHLALPYVVQLFQLNEIEEMCLVMALAPELDAKYEKLYATLHDDVTRTKPSVELVLQLLKTFISGQLLAQTIFDPNAKLMKFQLLRFIEPDKSPYLLSRCLHVDSQIVNFIIGLPQLDARLVSAAHFAVRMDDPDTAWLHDEHLRRVQKLIHLKLTSNGTLNQKLMFLFSGESGSGKQRLAEAVCRELGISLIIGDIVKLLHHPMTFAQSLFLLCREAHLHPTALCLLHTDSLFAQPEAYQKEIASFLDLVELFPNLTFVLGIRSWPLLMSGGHETLIEVKFEIPGPEMRKKLWNRFAEHIRLEDQVDFDSIADKFRFTPGRIQNALSMAQNMALWRNPEDGRVSMRDLHASCYAQTNRLNQQLADKMTPTGTLQDLILPPDQVNRMQELIDQVKYRRIVHEEWGFHQKLSRGKGLNILLHGPPGTGKTMAAEVIAKELELDLYRIDLSQVVSKYIGETEKNLHRIFQEAEQSYAILFFDEADALFGKRTEVKDALDRHANTEVAFLLQKMEEYDGITILATNLFNNLDAAFIRRMQFSIEFPLPDEIRRFDIWKAMFPKEAPRSEDIDFAFLAKKFKISGGHIKNIVLSAAFLAAKNRTSIGMEHIVPATKREMDKIGKLTSKDDFGPYYALLGGNGP